MPLRLRLSIAPDARSSFRDCVVSVKAISARPLAYLVDRVRFQGYAYLQKGVSATASLAWSVTGFLQPSPHWVDLTGPFDDAFAVEPPLIVADPVWSPCAPTRKLDLLTRLVVRREADAGSGYLNPTALAADGSARLRFRVFWHACPPPAL